MAVLTIHDLSSSVPSFSPNHPPAHPATPYLLCYPPTCPVTTLPPTLLPPPPPKAY